jgi:dTDP-4-dehydrorhamnose reductase
MLGQEFANYLATAEEDLSYLQSFKGFNRDNFDVSHDSQQLAEKLADFDVWINCIAYTAVDKAESEEAQANELNGHFVARMADAAAATKSKLIHYSTDYVFDGKSAEPYLALAPRNPQNAYGRSKALGEEALENSQANYAIIRTAWLYGEFGKCFVKTIANALKTRDFVEVVNDQFGQPTWTRDLVDLTMHYLSSGSEQTHIHGVSNGRANWFNLAQQVALSEGLDAQSRVREVDSSRYVTAASRPKFSVLNTENDFNFQIGDWAERWQLAAHSVLA